MVHNEEMETLQYRYEILRAQLRVKDYFLKSVFHDIHDHIGQLLALIRIQLSLTQQAADKPSPSFSPAPGELVEEVINDLREMCRKFDPEGQLFAGEDFYKAFSDMVDRVHPGSSVVAMDRDGAGLRGEEKLVLFALVLDLALQIKTMDKGQMKQVQWRCRKGGIALLVCYENAGSHLPGRLALPLWLSAQTIKKIKTAPGKLKLVITTRKSLWKK